MRGKSVRCGGGWPAPTTRPPRASAWRGCGTTTRWSSCRGPRSCPRPPEGSHGVEDLPGVPVRRRAQHSIQLLEQLRGGHALPARREQLERQRRVEVAQPAPDGEHPDVGGEGLPGGRRTAADLPRQWPVGGDECGISALDAREGPPLAHGFGQARVAELVSRHVLATEEVDE